MKRGERGYPFLDEAPFPDGELSSLVMGRQRLLTYQPGFLARLIRPRARGGLSLEEAFFFASDERQRKIAHISVKGVSLSQDRLWWKNLIVRIDGDEAVVLPGLSRFAVWELSNAIANWVSLHRRIERNNQITRSLNEFYKRNQYLANSDVARWCKDAQQLDHAFRPPLLDQIEDLLGKRTRLHEHNEELIKQELIRQTDFFDRVENNPLTKEQRRAAIVMEDRHVLIAPAGSGKTSAIVGKIGYALKKNLYDPSQIVALAFNRKAANELRQRMSKRLGDLNGTEVGVETFHALGLQFISQAKGVKPKVADWAVHRGEDFGRVGERLVSELCKTSPRFSAHWANLFSYFRWAMKPLHCFHSWKDYELYLLAIRAERLGGHTVNVRTIKGDSVRSLEECTIANWLYVTVSNTNMKETIRTT